ncbi:MAG: ABC transporter permease [Thermoanaerobaculia bacterium]|nr:ABC transporter permease [Thermoanaerobaculia bacterium]
MIDFWLILCGWFVPSERRREWRDEWRAELDYVSLEGAGGIRRLLAALGALPDAIWHFLDEWSFDTMWNDLTHALRALRRRVSTTFLAVLVLGLGLGAAGVVVSVVDTVLLRPLPFEEPERLVAVWEQNPAKGWYENVVAPANFFDWREQATTFEDMAFYGSWISDLIYEPEDAPPRRIAAISIGPRFFHLLGVPMALGRSFNDDETWQRAEPSVILSHQLWSREFAGDPDVLERTITIEGYPRRIVGVAPASMGLHYEADLWFPFRWNEGDREQTWFRRAHFLRAVGRLADGATVDDARAELATIAERLEEQYPATNTDMGTGVTPFHEWEVGDTRRPLALVAAAVSLLLMVACANVASLMLLRAGARAREMAVRSTLGAARRRLVRLVAMEGLLLATAASLFGYLFAGTSLGVLRRLSSDVPRLDQVALDPRTLVAGLAITLFATLTFSVVPALLGSRVDLRASLHQGASRHTGSRQTVRARRILVVAEVALAVLLVVGAGLFVRSLAGLYRVDPGFDAEGVLAVRVNVPGARYQEEAQVEALYDQIVEAAKAIPGVGSVGQSRTLPLGGGTWTSDFSLLGDDRFSYETQHLEIDEGYADAIGLRLLAGRHLQSADGPGSQRVALVSRELVRQILPEADSPSEILGRQLCSARTCTEDENPQTIVGVVEDTRFDGLAHGPRPMIYHSIRQRTQWDRDIFLRAASAEPRDLLALADPMRRAVAGADPGLPLMQVRSLEEVIDESLARERFLTALLTGFGALALVLALVGTYGVLATTVQMRRRELGIRAALGAGRGQLETWVVRQGLALLALGAAVGLGLAFFAGRFVESQLFAIHGRDPLTYLAAVAVLVVTGLVAAWVPARAASRVDPVTVLRAD